jgi:prepilin-type N-terminal cleavage/methylation domain-containing protein
MTRFALQRGFTIVELMVTLAIAAILLAVAVPSFTLFAQKRAISQKTVQVRNALELARGLALSQRQVWTVCTVDASNSCVSSAGLRLLVFRDDNDDKDFNTGEMLHQDIDIDSIELEISASGRPYIRFARSGEALESGNIEVCSTNQAVDYGRQAIVFRSGRIRLSNDSDGDGYDDAGGTKIDCPSS